MAVAITTPAAPSAAAGQYATPQRAQSMGGQALPDIVGTGATASGNVTVRYYADEANVDVTFTIAADGSGNYTTAGKVSYTPLAPGRWHVVVTDVTGATTATVDIDVEQSEGV